MCIPARLCGWGGDINKSLQEQNDKRPYIHICGGISVVALTKVRPEDSAHQLWF